MRTDLFATPIVIAALTFGLASCGGTTDAGPSAAPAAASDRQAQGESPEATETTAAATPQAPSDPVATSTPEPDASAPVEPSATPAEGSYGRALGTHVCIENQSGRVITVDFVRKDSSDGGPRVLGGDKACAEGTFSAGGDVAGEITLASGQKFGFTGFNPAIGYPAFRLTDQDRFGVCGGWEVDESHSFGDAHTRFTVTRAGDNGWKQFIVVIRPAPGNKGADCGSKDWAQKRAKSAAA